MRDPREQLGLLAQDRSCDDLAWQRKLCGAERALLDMFGQKDMSETPARQGLEQPMRCIQPRAELRVAPSVDLEQGMQLACAQWALKLRVF
ncbi:MAG TPA: hypothetical protein VJR89_10090 [Polyangiales bacterium]|nr:hypothetical protein [Polyangiales bacterium]